MGDGILRRQRNGSIGTDDGASARPRCKAVSVNGAQAFPLSGVLASTCAQIRSAVATSPLAKAR